MRKKPVSNKKEYSPLLLLLGMIFLFGAIFSFFMENKKKKNKEEGNEDMHNPKDFI
jgi:preprotein translocase subunit YajC